MKKVVVIGGGLAGLAAAAKLATRGFKVTILESKQRLGGRAGSFVDPETGQVIDACQHVSMGCCTEFAAFSKLVGIDHLLKPEPVLWFMTPDRRTTRFEPDRLPAPFHLSRAFSRVHYLSWMDKIRIAWGLACLRLSRESNDPPLIDWLRAHGQNETTINRFWSIVLVSALNESVDRVGLKYARKVFVDAFMKDRRGFEVQIPTVPLGELYGGEMAKWFSQNNVDIRYNARVIGTKIADRKMVSVQLRDGSSLEADAFLSAVPWNRIHDWLPEGAIDQLAPFEHSPITSVHFWFDRPILELPHVVLVDCKSQWIFNRGEIAPGEWYVQIVISSSGGLRSLGHIQLEKLIFDEINQLFPWSLDAKLLRSKVITEKTATFVPKPGIDQFRPGNRTKIENFFLAGDWTSTDWPSTMEGAVRSGFNAAMSIS